MTDRIYTAGSNDRSVTVNSHSGSDPNVVLSFSSVPARTFVGDKFVQSGKNWLINSVGTTTVTVSRDVNNPDFNPGSDPTNASGTISRAYVDHYAWNTSCANINDGGGAGVVSGVWQVQLCNDATYTITSSFVFSGCTGADGITKYRMVTCAPGESWTDSGSTVPCFPSQSRGVLLNLVDTTAGSIAILFSGTEQYCRYVGLQVKGTETTNTLNMIYPFTNFKVQKCLAYGKFASGGASASIYGQGGRAGLEVRGNVFIYDTTGTGQVFGVVDINSTSSAVVCENTILSVTDANHAPDVLIRAGSAGSLLLRDNVFGGLCTNEIGNPSTWDSNSGHNAYTNHGTAPNYSGTGTDVIITDISQELTGTTRSTADGRPKNTNHLQFGIADSTTDSYGQVRNSPPTIGALEFNGSAPTQIDISGSTIFRVQPRRWR